jgi:hypothetical protein
MLALANLFQLPGFFIAYEVTERGLVQPVQYVSQRVIVRAAFREAFAIVLPQRADARLPVLGADAHVFVTVSLVKSRLLHFDTSLLSQTINSSCARWFQKTVELWPGKTI